MSVGFFPQLGHQTGGKRHFSICHSWYATCVSPVSTNITATKRKSREQQRRALYGTDIEQPWRLWVHVARVMRRRGGFQSRALGIRDLGLGECGRLARAGPAGAAAVVYGNATRTICNDSLLLVCSLWTETTKSA